MLKELSSMKISGANFRQPTMLDLFNPAENNKIKTIKGALLYGKNGSGKSTIARGFRKISGEAAPVVGQVLPLDKDGRPINLSEDEKKHIFVFDEEYVDKNVKLHEEHLDTIVIVIDDPISSYDMENRIGILSFLKYELSTFLETNPDTKALIMTHDLMTFYDIHKIFEEIMHKCKKKGYANPPKFNRFELRNESLIEFKYTNRQEYTELIRIIYDYGQGKADNQEIVIGNIMRQTLEAFSTFEFKKGIDKISTDDDILSLLGRAEYGAYFKNLMYRLVLHGGSHKEDQVKSMKDLNFFTLISDQEKKRTAKDILCFIYLLNRPHLLSHLKDVDSDAEAKLDSWCEDILRRSVVI